MGRRYIPEHQYGQGQHLSARDVWHDQDVDDFLDGNFAQLRARRADQDAHLGWQGIQARNREVLEDAITCSTNREACEQHLNLLENIMASLRLRRASLVRQHEEILGRTTSDEVRATLHLRLIGLKTRSWQDLMTERAANNIVNFLHSLVDRLLHGSFVGRSELRRRAKTLKKHFSLEARSGRARRYGMYPWPWE